MTAVVLCSRIKSSRVQSKALIKYCDITHIEHLVMRLLPAEIPIFVAVPEADASHYMFLMDKYPKRVFISVGYDDNPLGRIRACAKTNKIDTIIRVTHDKIFIDPLQIIAFLNKFKTKSLDYIYSSNFVPGMAFEIISFDAIEKANKEFNNKNIEHISYAIKAIAKNQLNYEFVEPHRDLDIRLLVDYPEDVCLMDLLFSTLGPFCTHKEVLDLMTKHGWLRQVNRLPLVTIYTCAYNAEKWINDAMGSVAIQDDFKKYEYILIDDASKDKTIFHMGKFCQTYKNTKFYKNISNIGLASSSNRALKLAKGKYIIRLDADDYFSHKTSISSLVKELEERSLDIIYPSYYLGVSKKEIQKGNLHHHIGATLFRTSAINHVKFTDSLRAYEGLDVFMRAKDQLKIGYLSKPTFVYRQHQSSMSKNNLRERQAVKNSILSGLL
jgi:spore coat polysaccharide biosynthesis protein SpsF (cytidylyltransferase family)